jgi:hypothetical protein
MNTSMYLFNGLPGYRAIHYMIYIESTEHGFNRITLHIPFPVLLCFPVTAITLGLYNRVASSYSWFHNITPDSMKGLAEVF